MAVMFTYIYMQGYYKYHIMIVKMNIPLIPQLSYYYYDKITPPHQDEPSPIPSSPSFIRSDQRLTQASNLRSYPY